jgi:hypothetical protein
VSLTKEYQTLLKLIYLSSTTLGLFAFDMAFVNHMAAASLMVSTAAVLSIALLIKD